MQRYMAHFPAAGEVVIYDTSWYNRAGVERVMGFCTPEQTRRLQGRINDPRKTWKLTDKDLKSYGKWNDYTVARDAMSEATGPGCAPWHVAVTDDKKRMTKPRKAPLDLSPFTLPTPF